MATRLTLAKQFFPERYEALRKELRKRKYDQFRDRRGFVYLVRVNSRWKIGWATKIERRLELIALDCTIEDRIVIKTKNVYVLSNQLKQLFVDQRIADGTYEIPDVALVELRKLDDYG